jgi:type II secretory pathway pseudopilin PulG
MIELVFVIVVIGIIAAVAIPRYDRDLKQEAADTVLSYIRYTQHLALRDFREQTLDRTIGGVTRSAAQWQRSFWKITFESCSDGAIYIGVGSDKDYQGDTDRTEAALDPGNGLPIWWINTSPCKNGGDTTVSPNIFITKKFGVTQVQGSGSCANLKHLGFDQLGRPHVSFSGSTAPDYSSYVTTACIYTFTMSDGDTFSITISPETGYSFITTQNDS